MRAQDKTQDIKVGTLIRILDKRTECLLPLLLSLSSFSLLALPCHPPHSAPSLLPLRLFSFILPYHTFHHHPACCPSALLSSHPHALHLFERIRRHAPVYVHRVDAIFSPRFKRLRAIWATAPEKIREARIEGKDALFERKLTLERGGFAEPELVLSIFTSQKKIFSKVNEESTVYDNKSLTRRLGQIRIDNDLLLRVVEINKSTYIVEQHNDSCDWRVRLELPNETRGVNRSLEPGISPHIATKHRHTPPAHASAQF